MNLRMLWIAAAVLFVSACNGNDSSTQNTQNIEQQVDRLQAKLKARGYEVARGSTKLFTTDDCQYTISVLGNCLGNNPAAPYIVPTVPLWPDEYVDEGLRGVLGPTSNDTWGTHRMDKREAVLVVGMLPPPARYFGMQTYVFSRTGTINPNDPVYQSTQSDPIMHSILFSVVPKAPSRVMVFSSVGNSNNNVTIARQSGAVFNQERAFIISTDAAMAREMTDALVNEGVLDRNGVFSEPVSPSVARLGLDANADDFMTLIRYALPEDKDAGDAWRQQRPIAVLRVRDKNTNATEPWPAPVYDQKTAFSELGLTDNLSNLVSAVKQQWGQPSASTGQFHSLQLAVDLIGQHCLNRPMNCLGDTQDADYQAGPTIIPYDNTVIAVVGTLGKATGNAIYSALSVNWLKYLKGVANISDPDLQGSASRYSGAVSDTDKFYVQYLARDCTGLTNCFKITEEMVPKGDPIKLIQRNYVAPGSAREADPQQVLSPVAIVLDGTNRPASP
jgi:hypothetical protein